MAGQGNRFLTKVAYGFLTRGLAAALALPSLLAMGRAEDWPQWRGPNRQGSWDETGILESFPPEGLTVRWRFPVGRGFSSPVVARGQVYVTDAELLRPKIREQVYCLDAGTGKPLWSSSSEVAYPDWIFIPGQERGPGATPIVQDGKVYALGGFGHLVCLEAARGEVCWEKNLSQEYRLKDFPTDASPLIEGNLLILAIGGKPGAAAIALDKNSGREVWRALDEPPTHSSPIILFAGGARQLILWTQQSVSSLNPTSGQTYWREPLPTSADFAVATPVAQKNLLLVGGLMLKLETDRPGASVLWPQTRALSRRILSNTSTALIVNGHLFSAKSSGELVCLEADSGRQAWETSQVTDLKDGASIHLTRHGDSAFLFTDQGELIRARLTPAGYQEIGRFPLLEPTSSFSGRKVVWVAPAYANRHVYARNDQELICSSLAAKP